MNALVITYHAIEAGPRPLCVSAERFREHVQILVDERATTLTVSELARGLRAGTLPARAVAVTFDDGCESAVSVGVPALLEHGLTATIFAVAGHLGGLNDWASQPSGAPRLRLASKEALAAIARQGIEIGAHGMLHARLDELDESRAMPELRASAARLEDEVGSPVQTLAYPYGIPPQGATLEIVRRRYLAACTTRAARAAPGVDLHAIPRVDAHYLERPALFRRAVRRRLRGYLAARRVGAGIRGRL